MIKKSTLKKGLSDIIIMTVSSLGVSANSIHEFPEEKIVFRVYDTSGNLISEGNTLSEERIGKKEILRFICGVTVGIVSTYRLDGISDAFDFLSTNSIMIPPLKPGQTATIVSLDGRINNPYKLHSYEGVIWSKRNFEVIVR